jgi:putative ABC transport system permease protein
MELLFMAFKNLSRKKTRTVLLSAAIAFSLLIVMLISAIANSFLSNLTENVSNLVAGHVFVQGLERTASGKTLTVVKDDELIIEAARRAGFAYRYATKRSDMEATLVYEGKTALQSISGVDFANERFLPERVSLVEGSFDGMSAPNALVISKPIADKLGAKIGSVVDAKFKTVEGFNSKARFRIVGIMHDSGIFFSANAFANLAFVNEALRLEPDGYQVLGFYLDSLDAMDAASAALSAEMEKELQIFARGATTENPIMALVMQGERQSWEGVKYRIFTLNDLLAQAKQIVDYLDAASVIVLIVLFGIVMVGISNTFRIIMFERVREIGTMRATGMQRKQVRSLFLLEALMLAGLGILLGLAISFAAMGILSSLDFGLDNPLSLFMKNGRISFLPQAESALLYALIIGTLTATAVLMPAIKASKLSPAQALATFK